jgi:flagellar basal-body rod protein FlgG
MVRGLYTAASGMMAQQHRLDALSNNLSNVDLTGYKADIAVQKSFPELLLRRINDDGLYKFPQGYLETAPVVGKLGTGVEHNESYTVFDQGSLRETSNDFDFALEGEGFFVVSTPRGERYTRNGSFTLGVEGMLLTKEGYPVLGESGNPIYVKLNNFIVNSQAQILHNPVYEGDPRQLVGFMENDWETTEVLDTLKIVQFERPRYAKKEGGSLWFETQTSGPLSVLTGDARPSVRQGFTETSNVNPVQEMVRMISVNRAYEANQKIIATEDALLGKLIDEVRRY